MKQIWMNALIFSTKMLFYNNTQFLKQPLSNLFEI